MSEKTKVDEIKNEKDQEEKPEEKKKTRKNKDCPTERRIIKKIVNKDQKRVIKELE